MEAQKSINVTSRIKTLDIVSYKIEERQFSTPVGSDKITFGIGVSINVIEAEKSLTVASPIDIFSDETKKELLGSLQVKGEFIIENFEEIIKDNGIPDVVAATFVGVVISSARGILRILSKGTAFESAIIPIINPMAMIAAINGSSATPTL